ncbi:hypothetical protein Hdeb2414_s0007g00229501 [Helianthus debilis subsp. tardiflorus]
MWDVYVNSCRINLQDVFLVGVREAAITEIAKMSFWFVNFDGDRLLGSGRFNGGVCAGGGGGGGGRSGEVYGSGGWSGGDGPAIRERESW